jgi:hypothetical protein
MVATNRAAGFRVPAEASCIEKAGVEAFVWDQMQASGVEKSYLLAFIGKAKRPAAYYSFRNTELRDKYLADMISGQEAAMAYKVERQQARVENNRKAADLVKVGDIFRCSWGYEQTNVDYYQVISKKGSKVTIRKICASSTETGWLSGRCRPLPNQFISDAAPMVKTLRGCGDKSAAITMNSYSSAYLIEPDASGVYPDSYWSSYA